MSADPLKGSHFRHAGFAGLTPVLIPDSRPCLPHHEKRSLAPVRAFISQAFTGHVVISGNLTLGAIII